MMDYFAYLIANKTSSVKTVKVRKVYVNEDPTQDDKEPCPSCMARNQSSNVRYMYVNLQEAIYKCEAPNCMYPFRNFKFKNYTDNTVYVYTSAEETPPALEDFGQSFTNDASSPVKHTIEQPPVKSESSIIDFSFNFFSPERNNSNKASEHSPDRNTSLNIFDSPSLSYKNLVQDFDTGFIDDILQDLDQSSTEKPKPVLMSPPRPVESIKSEPGRQLKRCLQMFKDTAARSEPTFKVPPLPGAEVPNHPKSKPKKYSPLRRSKHNRRTHVTSGGSSPEKTPKKRNMKPLEFIATIKSLPPKMPKEPSEPKVPEVKQSCKSRVANMLNFIERSMKNRQPKPLATYIPPPISPPKHSVKRSIVGHRGYRKPYNSKSLSTAVLNDHQFEYSTSESEQEDVPEAISSPVKSEGDDISSDSQTLSQESCVSSEQSLPSFEDLLSHIHPGEPKMQPSYQSVHPVGFRSAGSSPTRDPQWAQTPPRRIHSMESLCGLLE